MVDDLSRMTWVYLLERKSDYLNTLMKFGEYMKTQFQGQIQVIRSDNVSEFSFKECEEYLTKRGLIHQKSCPYTLLDIGEIVNQV